jgi:purine-cytosine permease-like protein
MPADYARVNTSRRTSMKTLITTVAAAALATSFAMSADAASTKKKDTAMSAKQTACHEQAMKKYSAIHFLKRKAYEKKCMGTA